VNQLRGSNKKPEAAAQQPADSGAGDPGPTGTAVKGTVPKAAGAKAAAPKTAAPSANGASASGGGGAGGALRRLVKGRAEPEAQPPPPETKLIRQQPVRQPRSRRSGKR
jgi:hypothetical protein